MDEHELTELEDETEAAAHAALKRDFARAAADRQRGVDVALDATHARAEQLYPELASVALPSDFTDAAQHAEHTHALRSAQTRVASASSVPRPQVMTRWRLMSTTRQGEILRRLREDERAAWQKEWELRR
jgi:hypothetical protein